MGNQKQGFFLSNFKLDKKLEMHYNHFLSQDPS